MQPEHLKYANDLWNALMWLSVNKYKVLCWKCIKGPAEILIEASEIPPPDTLHNCKIAMNKEG